MVMQARVVRGLFRRRVVALPLSVRTPRRLAEISLLMIAGLGVTELARADVTWLAPRTVSEPGREAHAMAARRDAAMLVSAPRVFDGTRLIKDGAVLIRGGHVVGVGPRTTLRVRDARRVSLKNATVLPGFIGLHVHADTPRSARDGVMTVAQPRSGTQPATPAA
jgi:hypothetical protein